MVEGVEELRAKFQGGILSRPVEREFLRKGQVEIVLSGPFENAHARVAKPQRIGIVGAEHRGFYEALGIDIGIQIRSNRTRREIAARLAGAGKRGAIATLSKDVAAIRIEKDQQFVTRLKRRDSSE